MPYQVNVFMNGEEGGLKYQKKNYPHGLWMASSEIFHFFIASGFPMSVRQNYDLGSDFMNTKK